MWMEYKEVKELGDSGLEWLTELGEKKPDAYQLYGDLIQWFSKSESHKHIAGILFEYHPGITVEKAIDKIEWCKEMIKKLDEMQDVQTKG